MALLGVDHLAVTTSSLAQARDALKGYGFSAKFEQPGLPNHSAKAAFLSVHHDVHDIGFFCTEAPGIALEAVIHSPTAPPGLLAPYRPLLAGRPTFGQPKPATAWTEIFAEAMGITVEAWDSPGFEAEILTTSQDSPPQVTAIAADIADPDKERDFWVAMGFQSHSGQSDSWHRLCLPSPIPALRCELVLGRVAPPPPVTLDAPGFPCLAFLCSRLETELEVLYKLGAIVGVPFTLVVNNRELSIALFRSPGGLLGELIQPMKRKSI